MGLTQVSTDGVKNDAITKTKIPANQIEASELADNAVGTSQLANNAVYTAAIQDDAVTDAKLANSINTAIAANTAKASIAINNNANNRVITGSGTANTLEGESTLTFDDTNDVLTAGGGLGIQNVSGILAGNGGGQDYLGLKDSGNNFAFMVKTHGTNNGFVGIGETAPLAPLHIKPASNVKQLLLEQNNATDGYALFVDGPNGGHLKFMRHVNGSDTQRALLRSDGGLCFGSDTAAANALDDYEEGTWTPSITFGGGSTGVVYSSYRNGSYIKIGNMVHLKFGFQLSSKGSSTGAIKITGLPFNGNHAGYFHDAGASIMVNGGTDSSGGHALVFLTDTNKLAIRQGSFGNSNTDATHTAFNNNTGFFGNICYNTSA